MTTIIAQISLRAVPRRVSIVDWIVVAICIHVIAQQTLASGGIRVRVEESSPLRIIVPGLEVIEAGIVDTRLALAAFYGKFLFLSAAEFSPWKDFIEINATQHNTQE